MLARHPEGHVRLCAVARRQRARVRRARRRSVRGPFGRQRRVREAQRAWACAVCAGPSRTRSTSVRSEPQDPFSRGRLAAISGVTFRPLYRHGGHVPGELCRSRPRLRRRCQAAWSTTRPFIQASASMCSVPWARPAASDAGVDERCGLRLPREAVHDRARTRAMRSRTMAVRSAARTGMWLSRGRGRRREALALAVRVRELGAAAWRSGVRMAGARSTRPRGAFAGRRRMSAQRATAARARLCCSPAADDAAPAESRARTSRRSTRRSMKAVPTPRRRLCWACKLWASRARSRPRLSTPCPVLPCAIATIGRSASRVRAGKRWRTWRSPMRAPSCPCTATTGT